jgi:lysophospholipase L1-like esterase
MGDDYGLGRPFTSPDEYVSALERTIVVLRLLCGEGVAIIMATTTPTADTDPAAPHAYNELLKQVAARNGLAVNDLFVAIAPDLAGNISPDRVHLSETGTAIAAARVTAAIEKYL